MPNYCSWEDMGLRIDVRDQNRWKIFLPAWNDYYIGDSVKLVITIERLSPDAPSFKNLRIAEKLPSSEKYIPRKIGPGRADFTTVKFAIRGDILDTSGDDVWRLEVRSKKDSIEKSRRIFDAGISSRDSGRRDVRLVALAFVFGLPSCLVALVTLWFEYQMYLQGLHK
jgi:hypothetical protein